MIDLVLLLLYRNENQVLVKLCVLGSGNAVEGRLGADARHGH